MIKKLKINNFKGNVKIKTPLTWNNKLESEIFKIKFI
jgi:hypothetical protein